MDNGVKLYKGFISYSHADKATAAKLLKQLQTYRLPKTLAHIESRSLGQFFMDRDSLPAAESLSDAIVKGLSQSEHLIVLCSPDAAASKWVNLEIETFRKVNPSGSVFAVVLSGDPAAVIDSDASFPAAIRDGGKEPLAADFRREADGPKLGFLKLAAALSDTRLEDLLRRDQRRTRRRVTAITVTAGAVALSMSLLAASAISARQEAEARQADAEGLVDFMLTDLRDKLEPVGRLDVLDGVAQEALDYYDAFDETSLDCEQVIRKARALHIQTQILTDQSDYLGADNPAAHGLELMTSAKPRCSTSNMFTKVLGHSHYWSVYPDYQRASYALSTGATNALASDGSEVSVNSLLLRSKQGYEKYGNEIESLKGSDEYSATYILERADNEANLGSVSFFLGDIEQARKHFTESKQTAEALAEDFLSQEPDSRQSDVQLQKIAFRYGDVMGWLSFLSQKEGQLEEALKWRLSEAEVYQRLITNDTLLLSNRDWLVYRALLGSQLASLRLKSRIDPELSISNDISLLRINSETLLSRDPTNVDWKRLHCAICKLEDVSDGVCAAPPVGVCQ